MKIRKKVIVAAGLLAVAAIGGTWAYFNQTLSVDNPLDTGYYNVQLVEQFTPPKDTDEERLRPGQQWTKVVTAVNTGTYPVLVRVRMEESWSREEQIYQSVFSGTDSAENGGKSNEQFNPFDKTKGWQLDPNDGDWKGDGSVVYKHILTENGWLDGGDGYWYWNGILEGEKTDPNSSATTPLMDWLAFTEDIDLGYYHAEEWYAVGESQPKMEDESWEKLAATGSNAVKEIMEIAETLGNGQNMYRRSQSVLDTVNKGYSDSEYLLTITSEFLQANQAAVEELWPTCPLDSLTNVKGHLASEDSSAAGNHLEF